MLDCWYEYWDYLYLPGGYWVENCDYVQSLITWIF
jgi:hypothetical protein